MKTIASTLAPITGAGSDGGHTRAASTPQAAIEQGEQALPMAFGGGQVVHGPPREGEAMVHARMVFRKHGDGTVRLFYLGDVAF